MFARLMLATFLATALATAQRGAGGGMGGDEGGGRGGMGGDADGMGMRQHKASRLEIFADRLKLSKAQKPDVDRILLDGAKESGPLREQLIKGREALAEAMLSGKTGAELDEVVKSYSALEAQMTFLEVRVFSRICSMLKPNQQAKAAPAFELLDGVFDAPPQAGSRSGGGRRDR